MIYNMFYTLASRMNINGPRNKLYIFLVGSLCYIVIHWYLHMDTQTNIFMNTMKNYLYYIMVADIVVACVATYLYPKKNQIDKAQPEKKTEQYTQEQSLAIAQKMQEARRLQFMRQQEIDKNAQNKNSSTEPKGNLSKEQTNPAEPVEPQQEETNELNKVASVDNVKETKENNTKESNTMSDTEIPLFNKQ